MAQHVQIPPMDEPINYTVGSTPQSVFAIPFPFWDAGDIIVKIDGVLLPTADYSVAGLFVQNGDPVEGAYGSGTLTLDVAVSNVTVTVDRLIEPERETDFSKTGPFSIPNLNSDLDKATARDQDILRMAKANKAALDAVADDVATVEAAAATATTKASEASTSASSAASSATAAEGAASTATTQAGLATTAATNSAASETSAASSATNAAASATAAAGSASAASGSATNAAASASAADASETAAAGSASAGASSASAASASATAAAGSATDAAAAAAQLYLAETVALGAAFTSRQTRERMALIDDTINQLKTTRSLWSKLGVLFMPAAGDEQAGRINWKNPGVTTATVVGTLGFTPDVGFVGGGAGYIDTNIAMASVPGYGASSHHVGVWVANGAAADNYVIGGRETGSRILLRPRGVGGSMVGSMGPTNYSALTLGAVAARTGHFVLTRNSSSHFEGYRNGGLVAQLAQTFSGYGASTNRISVLYNATSAQYTEDTVSIVHAGAGLDADDVAALHDIFDSYMTRLVSGADKLDRDAGNVVNPTTFRSNIGAAESTTSLTIWQQNTVTAELLEGNTASTNADVLFNAAAAAEGKTLLLPKGHFPLAGSLDLSGPREIRGFGKETVMDFSGAASATTRLNFSGSLSATAMSLASNADIDARSIVLTDASTVAAGDRYLLLSDEKVHVADGDQAQSYGEWIDVDSVSSNTLHLKAALRLPYEVAMNARVRKVTMLPGLTAAGFVLIGTGQTYSDGAQASGDHGIQITYCADALVEGVELIRCNRQAFRFERNLKATLRDWRAEFQAPLTTAEIQYGVAVIGCHDQVLIENGACVGGRHGIDQVGDHIGGLTFNLLTFGNLIRDTYASAIAEHSGLASATYSNDTIESCGGGYDMRGPKRKVVHPTVRNGYNGAVNGEAFVIGGNCSDVEITDMEVDNVRYVARCQTLNFVDNHAPRNVTFRGGTAQNFTNGIHLFHLGGENPSPAGAGTYNTAVGGGITLDGLRLLASPPREGGAVTSPVRVEGYWDTVNLWDNEIAFVDGATPTYPAFFRGVENILVKGSALTNTRAIFIGESTVIDASGSNATRTPVYASVKDNDCIDLQTDTDIINTAGVTLSTKIVRSGNDASNLTLPGA